MRVLLIVLLLFPLASSAQPGQPSFCFVLAEDRSVVRPIEREVRIVQHFRERVPYVGYSGSWLKPEQEMPLHGGPLFRDSTARWVHYYPAAGMAESYLLITAAMDTMRIELPEDETLLWQRAIPRGGSRDTPEVIRFRNGTYRIEDLIVDRWAVRAAQRLNERWVTEDRAEYKRELAEQAEYYRNLPPPAPPTAPYIPPPPQEEWEAELAKQPGLKKVQVDRVNADTVWVRITGRVMLDGGCASGMPLFGLEMPTDTGWVERIPFELIQMDCGMPWADWEDHVVMLPLRWWVAANSRERELVPGGYRLFFLGGDGKAMRSVLFTVR